MTGWTPDVSQITILEVGVIQGIGLGFLFVPLSVATLATLSPERRAEGAGIYGLSRPYRPMCVGISVVNSLLTSEYASESFRDWVARVTSVESLRGEDLGELRRYRVDPSHRLPDAPRSDAVVTRQAQIIACNDDQHRQRLIATLAASPAARYLHEAISRRGCRIHTQVME